MRCIAMLFAVDVCTPQTAATALVIEARIVLKLILNVHVHVCNTPLCLLLKMFSSLDQLAIVWVMHERTPVVIWSATRWVLSNAVAAGHVQICCICLLHRLLLLTLHRRCCSCHCCCCRCRYCGRCCGCHCWCYLFVVVRCLLDARGESCCRCCCGHFRSVLGPLWGALQYMESFSGWICW